MSEIPPDLRYTREHEWVAVAGDVATIGVTAYAAEQLGDVVHLDLPEPGAHLAAGSIVGEIESTKSVSELYAPVEGEVLEANDAAIADPALVNADPYGTWLLRVRVAGTPELLDAAGYAEVVGE